MDTFPPLDKNFNVGFSPGHHVNTLADADDSSFEWKFINNNR